ncbi:GNAT family N-acetyltransferase [Actinophytocola sp.]|uniref:GNAT family N-acetyltransferase n=1 Tax=Actinophytocola sp. TaxID=1872138 RepID=UPI002D7EF27F|nr:GNAT family N-acetyltransferase [Actinophytocola sp.]HET9138011.1 GNAT family N-acetyltransferase [Actinophytocola sp.]
MHDANVVAARIAAAQLSGLRRKRTVVSAPPFIGLLTPGGHPYLSYAVGARPGTAITDLADSLPVLRDAFAPNPMRFELIEEANPGAADVLRAAGLRETGRYPLLTLDVADLVMPPAPDGASVQVLTTLQDAGDAQAVAAAAFDSPMQDPHPPGEPADGGGVLARLDGRPVAAAFWTPVADGVTEIAGVATLPEYRTRGLGALVTAAAVASAGRLAGATLAWLTPGSDGADRIYRRVGFMPTATAVHLTG